MTNQPWAGSTGSSHLHCSNNSSTVYPSYYNQPAQVTSLTSQQSAPKCRICGSVAIQPTWLSCRHSFCYMCVRAYVERKRYTDSLDFPCPHCNKLSAPPWGIWHLSHKVLDRSHDEKYQTWRYEAMCDNCAKTGLYATAGRHCTQCNISLCDTCSYAHSVMMDTNTHVIKSLSAKSGNNQQDDTNITNQDINATAELTNNNRYVSSWLTQRY